MILVGIDIGMSGAVAGIDHRHAWVADLPVVAEGGRLCGRGLADLLRQHCPVGEAVTVLFEDVRPRPMGNGNRQGNTMHSQGSLMRSRGVVEAVLDVLRLESRAIQPQAWKRHYGLIKAEKGASLDRARTLFPSIAPALSRQKDHNRAEALLIALYGQKVMA